MFAAKPQLAGALLDRAQALGSASPSWRPPTAPRHPPARDGLCDGGRANHVVTAGSGRTVTAAQAASMIPARAWQRMRTGSGPRAPGTTTGRCWR
jgi:hypothetical protein